MQTNSPIFIVGANRSGTTLLRLILNAHPRIGIPEEVSYLNPWIAEHWRETVPDRDAFRHRVQWQLQHSMQPDAFPGIDHEVLCHEVVDQAEVYDYRAVYQGALGAWARYHGKVRWGEKTPGNLFYVDTLRAMFPEAQFIHLVRDPRAGVQSMQTTSFFSSDVVLNALNRRKYLREGLRRDATMPPDRWMRIRYEDLLASPEETVRTLCRFLGERFDPCMLRYYDDAEQYMKPAAANSFNQTARQPIDPTKITAWRNHLRPQEIAAIEALCHEEMRRLGYALDGHGLSVHLRLVVAVKSMYWFLSCLRGPSPAYLVVNTISDEFLQRLSRAGRTVREALSFLPLRAPKQEQERRQTS